MEIDHALSSLFYSTNPAYPNISRDGRAEPSEMAEAGLRSSRAANLGAPASPDFFGQLEEEIPFLRRNARRWYRENADAEDLVQDTLVQALANAHLWQPGTDLRAWLYTIMRNRALAGLKKSARSATALERI